MNQVQTLISLTRVAFLNAIVLSLLGIQFLIPPSFIVMLLLVPMVYLLQMYTSSFRHVFLSCVLMLALTLSLYGVGIFAWTAFYSLVGVTSGLAIKMGFVKPLRVIIIAIAYITSFALFIAGLSRLIGLEWQEIAMKYDKLTLGIDISFTSMFVVGIVFWGIALSLCIDWLVQRVLRQISI
jgi:hypothetical protein